MTDHVLIERSRGYETMRVLHIDESPQDRALQYRSDVLIVEEPLTIRLDGNMVATTMRTPGHDDELAVGHCFTEGLLGGAAVEAVHVISRDPDCVDVRTGGRARVPEPRLGVTSSSCGLCGTVEIDAVTDRLAPLDPHLREHLSLEVLADIPRRVQGQQKLFAATGAVHAAAVLSAQGEVLCLREDVGRHNALDKVVGRLVLDDALPGQALGTPVQVAYVSGRASLELVLKAWAAGCAALVAVSAPTAMAVHTARRAGLALAGFVRPSSMNLYSPEHWEAAGVDSTL